MMDPSSRTFVNIFLVGAIRLEFLLMAAVTLKFVNGYAKRRLVYLCGPTYLQALEEGGKSKY